MPHHENEAPPPCRRRRCRHPDLRRSGWEDGAAALGAATGCTLDLNKAFNAAGSYNLISGGTVGADACALVNFDSKNCSAVFTDGTLVVPAVPESLPAGLSVAGALASVFLCRRRRAKTAG